MYVCIFIIYGVLPVYICMTGLVYVATYLFMSGFDLFMTGLVFIYFILLKDGLFIKI